jgi:uncharacterized membrane protein
MDSDTLDQELTDQDRVLLVFGYLGPLALVSLVASRREFVKWHAKQGIVLSATLVAIYPILKFVHFILDRYFWDFFGELFWIAAWMAIVGIVVTMLVCIIRGLEGERFRVPILGELADRL